MPGLQRLRVPMDPARHFSNIRTLKSMPISKYSDGAPPPSPPIKFPILIGIRFDQLLCRRAFEADPSFRWCTNPKCDAGQIVTNGGSSHISLSQYFSLIHLQTKSNSSPVQRVGITPATDVNPLVTGIRPASKPEPKDEMVRKRVLRRAGLKRIPRRVIRVDDIVRKSTDAII